VGPVTRFALQPRWLAWHLLLVVVLVSFGWLGRWQLGSFEHKNERAAVPAGTVPLDRVSSPGGRLSDAAYGRRVTATGRYDVASTLLVPDRQEPGGSRRGYLVVAFLRTGSGVQPVVRGWAPSATAPQVRAPAGSVRVTGLLQPSETGPQAGSPAAVPTGRLPYVATVTVLDATRYRAGELYDGYLALRVEHPAGQAQPVPVRAQAMQQGDGGVGRWRNLAYALQWWLFAAAAVFFWWSVLKRAEREQAEPSPGPDAGPPSPGAPRRTTSGGSSLRP
jgi:cytochrome oxidase assembly protein ShyY1